MLIVHNFPQKDPLAHLKQADKPDNYFRVRNNTETHVFIFAGANHAETSWALSASRKVFEDLGGEAKGASMSLWRRHPDLHRIEIIGEGAMVKERSKPVALGAN